MYQLFQDSPLHPAGGFVYPDHRRVREGLQRELQKVIDYRRLNPKSLNASHLLVRLIGSLNVPLTLEPSVFIDKVGDIAFNLAMSLKMTSALYRGQVFTPGVFYGEYVTEILVANTDPFDVEDAVRNWKDLEPIRVLYHPLTDLKLHVPDGRHNTEEGGMAVISINIPMLALQYKLWRNWERGVVRDESPRTLMMFLQAFPLPNMLRSHLDIAIMNRMIGKYFDVEMKDVRSRHSFQLIDWTRPVDNMLDAYLNYVDRKSMTFDTIISNLPLVCHDDLHEVIRLPDMAFTQQLQWAVIISRLALVLFLVQLNANQENSYNTQNLNYIRRYLRYQDSAKLLRHALPVARYEDVMAIIDKGIMPYLE